MNREAETMFRDLPEVKMQRSKLDIPHNVKTTWTVGKLTPLAIWDVIPGSTFNMKAAAVMRMNTPLYPIFDNLYTDIMFFYVPYRLVWAHWAEFWGENNNAWAPTITYQVPQIVTNTTNKFVMNSVADYMGLPVGQAGLTVNALPFRAYAKVYNDWFRSTPLQQEIPNTTADTTFTTDPNDAYKGGYVRYVGKLHDLFTSALPYPERTLNEINIPLGLAPVYTTNNKIENYINLATPVAESYRAITGTSSPFNSGSYYNITGKAPANGKELDANARTDTATGSSVPVYPNNLWADLNNTTGYTIRALREALAVTHFYERTALYGGRYTELLRGVYGVVSPDGRLQRSEYLGGHRIVHNVQTVVQTSSTDSVSPQGNTGAYSHTVDNNEYFTKSFTEHGVILALMVTRYKHTYQNNVPKIFSQKKFTDYYLPQFEGIGQVPILNKEVWYDENLTDNDDVFGYQEYGYEWRHYPDTVTGKMRSGVTGSLDVWHFADDYTARPVLGDTWIKEDPNNVERTMVIQNTREQLYGDFYFKPTVVLPMPLYSIPGMHRI